MSDNLKQMSVFDIFAAHSETLEDAKKKSAAESGGKRIEMFRMDKEGTFKIRILPNAPVQNAEGDYELPRPGYEYPAKESLLKIKVGVTKDGKDRFQYVNVRHFKHIFPQLEKDLIDLFVEIACEKYADDEELCKSICANSFSGGLKYDNKRYMYVLDLNNRTEGPKLLSLSYSQYKDLEDRKLAAWTEECIDNPDAQCPISSVTDAYPVEITRKKDNGKTNYSFNINVRRKAELTEDELKQLMEMPRLPEQLYRFSRFHLEATLAFLKQYEEKKDIDVLSDDRIKELVEQVKLLLPSDDNSHFNPNKKDDDDASTVSSQSIDDLWNVYNQLLDNGMDDKTADGQNLRSSIIDFINDNNLDIAYSRRATNRDLLELIDDALGVDDDDNADDSDDAPEVPKSAPVDDPDDDDDAPASSPRQTRNDDTNEPAVREDRRANRPVRRRR